MTGKKMNKMRKMVSKWQKLTWSGKVYSPMKGDTPAVTERCESKSYYRQEESESCPEEIPDGFFRVYVGKEKRRYVINSEYLSHPLFRSLLEKSEGSFDDQGGIKVPCEVVMFEHLLWMLQNADSSSDAEMERVDELLDFYAY